MSSPNALIIDDRRSNIDVLAMLLAEQGVTSTAVEGPSHIADALRQATQIDVVFLDLEFPNQNGLNLIRQLRAEPRLRGVPIVAYTVHTSEINEAKAAGFDSFLGKPLDAKQFPGQLRRILAHEAVWE